MQKIQNIELELDYVEVTEAEITYPLINVLIECEVTQDLEDLNQSPEDNAQQYVYEFNFNYVMVADSGKISEHHAVKLIKVSEFVQDLLINEFEKNM